MRMHRWTLSLPARRRGLHVVTEEVLDAIELPSSGSGLLHLFLQHTSAALTLNENASPEVRGDLERWLRRAVPDGDPDFRHRLEGDDDMPAHIKASLFGAGLLLPVADGRVQLGTWQGIYLCEFRRGGGARRLLATALLDD